MAESKEWDPKAIYPEEQTDPDRRREIIQEENRIKNISKKEETKLPIKKQTPPYISNKDIAGQLVESRMYKGWGSRGRGNR